MLIGLVVVGLSSIACASGEATPVPAPVPAPVTAPVDVPVPAPEPSRAGKRRGGGSEQGCKEAERTCRNGDLYTCIEGTSQLLEDCEDQFGCTTTAAGFEGQAMCAWGGG
jgi:hypothetical protein